MTSGKPIQSTTRPAMRRILALGAALMLLTVALPGAVRSAQAAMGPVLGTEVTSYENGDDPNTQPLTAAGEFGVDRTAPVVVLFALLLAVAAFGLLVSAAPRRLAKEPRNR